MLSIILSASDVSGWSVSVLFPSIEAVQPAFWPRSPERGSASLAYYSSPSRVRVLHIYRDTGMLRRFRRTEQRRQDKWHEWPKDQI